MHVQFLENIVAIGKCFSPHEKGMKGNILYFYLTQVVNIFHKEVPVETTHKSI